MNDRRIFLQVLGSSAVALGAGCTSARSTGSGAGGGGAGGGATTSTTGTGATSTTGTSSSGTGTSSTTGTSSSSGTTTSTGTGTTTDPNCEMSPVGTKIGKPTDYATNGLHIVTNQSTLVGHDAGGYYALTAICTHEGCDMAEVDAQGPFGELSGQDITCLCHGSEFSPTGAVVHGPANKALRAHPLALGCDGFLYVDKTKFIAATVRLMV
jgi:Rieske Fe-S protein